MRYCWIARGRDKAPGEFRRIQNWIGQRDVPLEQAAFVPPHPLHVPECLDNWEKYYHSDDHDPLAQLASVHAQFEIIHPFLDGNGRLGRIVIPLFLYEKKLLSRPMFYLSGWLEEHREEYVSRLRDLGQSDGAWTRWIEFFLTAIDAQATRNAQTAQAIMDLYERLKVQILNLTHSQYAVPMLDQIFARPIFQSTHLVFSPVTPSRAAVGNLLKKLSEAGILKVLTEASGRRASVYAIPELINLCEGKTVL